ncbi:MAG: PEP-CTERM sorting domain-containing protein [Planctomycetia bacterium]|nr:PEP-CTERM sorting domain-containing protein [Planctomycetia bacterium]
MRNAKSRRGNQVLAAAVGAAGVMGLAAGAQAVNYYDSFDGNWVTPGTWGLTTDKPQLYGTNDSVYVDSNIVTTNGGSYDWAENVYLNTGGRINIAAGTYVNLDGPSSIIHFNGGTLGLGSAAWGFRVGGPNSYFAMDKHSTVDVASGQGELYLLRFVGSTSGPATRLTKTGAGILQVGVGQALSPTWGGYIELAEGSMYLDPSVNLNYGVHVKAGTTARISGNNDYAAATVYGGLTGTGVIGRTTKVTTLTGSSAFIDPGNAVSGNFNAFEWADHTTAGTLKFWQYDNASTRKLVVTSGAQIRIDVTGDGNFGTTNADQLLFVTGASTPGSTGTGYLELGTDAELRIRLFDATADNKNFTFDVVQAGTIAGTLSAANVKWYDVNGTLLGSGNNLTAGEFKNLSFSVTQDTNTGTVDYVRITGTTVVPEPASAAMLLAPGALMALRRKKRN